MFVEHFFLLLEDFSTLVDAFVVLCCEFFFFFCGLGMLVYEMMFSRMVILV